jgi:hypothetical protein
MCDTYPRIVLDSNLFSVGLRQTRVLAGSSVIRLCRRGLSNSIRHLHCTLPRKGHKRDLRSIRKLRLDAYRLSME